MQAAVPGCFVKRWWGRGPQKSPPETFVRGLAVPPCSTPMTMPKKDPKKLCAFWGLISVPVVGVEPTRCHHQRILSPSRLPIPTHRLVNSDIIITALRRVVKPGGGICHFLKKQIFLKKSVDKRPAHRYNNMRRLMTGAALYCPIAQLVRAPDC